MQIAKRLQAGAFAAALVSGVVAAGSAHAVFLEFYGTNPVPTIGTPTGDPLTQRNAFLGNLSGGVGTEDFEGIPFGTNSPIGLSFPGSSGGITATLTGSGSTILDDGGSSSAGRWATSGSQYLQTSGGVDFTISFSSAISAFGFYGTDIGDIGADLVLTLSNSLTMTSQQVTLDTSAFGNGNLLFYGFIDTTNTWTDIAFDNTGSGDVFGFDDMTIGDIGQVQIMPEASTLGLLGLGLLGLGLTARRRKAC